MANQVEKMPVDDMTMADEEMAMPGAEGMDVMPDEEMAMPGAEEMDVMPGEEMAMSGKKQTIEFPGTWKLILSQTSLKRSGCS
jgi:hypothetical protein